MKRIVFYTSAGREKLKAKIVEAKVAGWTYQRIADQLNFDRMPCPSGQGIWTPATVWSLARKDTRVRPKRRCIRCNQRATSGHKSKYCATCKDEVREEYNRAYSRKAYAKKHPRAGE